MDDIRLPPITARRRSDYPPLALASTKPWPYLGVTPDQARECKRAYYAAISFVDAQIGRVLDAVDRLGLRDNTIIVFWSDHGYHLGEHGLWFKQSCFEEVGPGAADHHRAGPEDGRPGQLAPGRAGRSVSDAGGPRRPDAAPGPARVQPAPAARQSDRASGSIRPSRRSSAASRPGHSVRTERWRYTEWDFGAKGEELYDQENDPQELHNLAADAKYADVVAHMKGSSSKLIRPVPGGKAEPGTKEKFSN